MVLCSWDVLMKKKKRIFVGKTEALIFLTSDTLLIFGDPLMIYFNPCSNKWEPRKSCSLLCPLHTKVFLVLVNYCLFFSFSHDIKSRKLSFNPTHQETWNLLLLLVLLSNTKNGNKFQNVLQKRFLKWLHLLKNVCMSADRSVLTPNAVNKLPDVSKLLLLERISAKGRSPPFYNGLQCTSQLLNENPLIQHMSLRVIAEKTGKKLMVIW